MDEHTSEAAYESLTAIIAILMTSHRDIQKISDDAHDAVDKEMRKIEKYLKKEQTRLKRSGIKVKPFNAKILQFPKRSRR